MAIIALTDIFGLGGRRADLADLLARTERHVRALPGARRYAFTTRLGAPDDIVLISVWESQVAMDAYHRSPEFAAYQAELHGLLARPSEMTVYTVTDALRPVPSGQLDPRDAD